MFSDAQKKYETEVNNRTQSFSTLRVTVQTSKIIVNKCKFQMHNSIHNAKTLCKVAYD